MSKDLRSPFSVELLRHLVFIGETQRWAYVSLSERGNENIKYFISANGNRTHNRRDLQSQACFNAL